MKKISFYFNQRKNNTLSLTELTQEDPAGNDDERVKEYVGTAMGRVLTIFELSQTYITGNIDSEGDQTCELYLDFVISGKYGGPTVEKSLFNYSVCIN